MPTTRGIFVRKDSTRGTGPAEARVALAGLLTPAGDLAATPGVISGAAVTGRSTSPLWAYSVSAGHVVTTRGGTDGAVLWGLSGATDTPTVSAAPASGSRWDLIWVRHRDVDNADPDSDAVLGVTSGTASGSPTKPYGSVPAGALVLAEAQVGAGATGTLHANVTITQVAARVGTRGGIISVASAYQQSLITSAGTPTNPIYTDLNGVVYRSTGTAWTAIGSVRTVTRYRSDVGHWGETVPAGVQLVEQMNPFTGNTVTGGMLDVMFDVPFTGGIVSVVVTPVTGPIATPLFGRTAVKLDRATVLCFGSGGTVLPGGQTVDVMYQVTGWNA